MSSETKTDSADGTAAKDDLLESILRTGEYHLDVDEVQPPSPERRTTLTREDVINKFKRAADGARNYRRGESDTIRQVLDELDHLALKRSSEGFNEFNFSLGVLNCFLISHVFAAYPEHLWLLYLVEGLYLIPRKFYNMWRAKPLNQALYYLDFCWCMNFLALLYLIAVIISEGIGMDIDDSTRRIFGGAFLGVFCGPLLGANIVLGFIAMIFHDVNTMTSFFIHIMPPLVAYTFLWYTEEMKTAWPTMFHLGYLNDLHFFAKDSWFGMDSVIGYAIALYFMWWIPYVCFMLAKGLNLPKKTNPDGTPKIPRFDTVYHSTMRGGVCIAFGKTFRGRSKHDSLKQMTENDFDLIDFFIYMAFHMIAAVASFFLIGFPCYCSKRFHIFIILVALVLAVSRGAGRYTYYSTKMYSNTLRKHFAHVLNDSKES